MPGRATRFLERAGYRQRRLRDIAWVLPVVGILLVCVPMLWPRNGAFGTADAVRYLFAVWFLLIVATACLAAVVRPDPDEAPPGDEGR